jgi:uncharacterized integral membrane protein
MNKTRAACILTVTILFIVFVVQNSGHVTARFLFFDWYIPKSLLICVSVLLGVVLGLVSAMRK